MSLNNFQLIGGTEKDADHFPACHLLHRRLLQSLYIFVIILVILIRKHLQTPCWSG